MARGENRRESDRAVIAARETGLNRALAGHHWGLALDSYLLSQLSPLSRGSGPTSQESEF